MVATSATRDAANAQEFTDRVVEVLGVAPEVISGDAEARLSFTGATRELLGTALGRGRLPPPYLVTDIGGGSTEFVLGGPEAVGEGGRVIGRSVNIGCVRLTERHLHADPPRPAEIAATTADIDAALQEAAASVPVATARTLVGLAGSVTTVAAIALGLPGYDSARIHHSRVSAERVHEIAARPAGDDPRRAGGDSRDAPGTGRRDRRGRAHPRPDHEPLRVHRGPGQRARHPRRHRLVAGAVVADGPGPDGDAAAPFVPPGTGWPGDPADADTPVASTAAQVAELAERARGRCPS